MLHRIRSVIGHGIDVAIDVLAAPRVRAAVTSERRAVVRYLEEEAAEIEGLEMSPEARRRPELVERVRDGRDASRRALTGAAEEIRGGLHALGRDDA